MTAIALDLRRHLAVTPLRAFPRTGGDRPPVPEDHGDPAAEIWSIHDPGRPPPWIAGLAVAITTALGILAAFQA